MNVVAQATGIALPAAPADYAFVIGGEQVPVSAREAIERSNPAHDVVVSRYPRATTEDVAAATAAARRAADARVWSGISGAERSRVLLKVASLLDENMEMVINSAYIPADAENVGYYAIWDWILANVEVPEE